MNSTNSDTISLELSTEEVGALAQAPENGPSDRTPERGKRKPQAAGNLHVARRMTLLVFVVIAVALVGMIGYLARANVPAPRENTPPRVAPIALTRPVEPPAPESPPVRFPNPFDRTEVFEFPAGTSKSEARAAVAEILLKRAQERGLRSARTRVKVRSESTPGP